MDEPRDLEQLREDVEARQKNILPQDLWRNARYFTPFDSDSGPGRGATAAFAVLFLLIAAALFACAYEQGLEIESVVTVLIGLGPLALSVLLMRRVFRGR